MNVARKVTDLGLKFTKTQNKRKSTTHLYIHHRAGNGDLLSMHNDHINRAGKVGVGYHYFIRKNGEIFRGRSEDRVGAHLLGHNSTSIGICFEGNFEFDTMASVQYDAGLWLIRDILSRYPTIKIAGHRQKAATACPGRNFPLEKMLTDSLSSTPAASELQAAASTDIGIPLNEFATDMRAVLKLNNSMSAADILAATVTVGRLSNNRHVSVDAIQKLLKRHGFYTGEIDRSFGPKSDQATRLYQAKIVGLKTPDGIWTGWNRNTKTAGRSYRKALGIE